MFWTTSGDIWVDMLQSWKHGKFNKWYVALKESFS